MAVFQGSIATHLCGDSLKRLPGFRMVVLMVVVYYSKRMHSRVRGEKAHQLESRGIQM